jgi:hypothetical protein
MRNYKDKTELIEEIKRDIHSMTKNLMILKRVKDLLKPGVDKTPWNISYQLG